MDACGARRTYVASMLTVGALACTYSLMTSSGGIALIAFLVEFLSTPVYPCHVQVRVRARVRVRVRARARARARVRVRVRVRSTRAHM